MEVVLASHSYLAKGMYETVSLIMGKQTHLHYLTAYVEEGVDFKDQLATATKSIKNEQIIFVSDVIGGSVNNELVNFVKSNCNYFLVSGMNLPFILELLTYTNELKNESVNQVIDNLKTTVDVGRAGLKVVELDDDPISEEDF
ncbi:PTS sugar transporter subunit IIA [Pediococcus acidilactici]|uniref:PTS sugar transporter subunit IIA n=1 Tax=Pediococcus acidilactici TaxID=1254 RepID=UPI001F4E96DF|nr:hypothetical protein [Pediococcus acidilactici]MCH9267697.1 hypothetical protein [Pediococcus acidilactici]MCJ2387022.1 hypothetical protein [Pediococcus acidilactici]MCK2074912.1 hypothetical protein [Pediococcus acidilactici]MDM5041851.1 hypothetical protein [Pediococcus acidilactici]MDV2603875.1 hypothetical protein [Pediococcus acidilactici]